MASKITSKMARRFTFLWACCILILSIEGVHGEVKLRRRPRRPKHNVQLTINTNQKKRIIPTTLYGVTPGYQLEKDSYWTAASGNPAADHIGGAFWRFPGGEVTSYFHWEKPTGRGWRDSWDPTWKDSKYVSPENWMSLDEFWLNKEKVGAEALLGVNVRSGWKWNRDSDGLEEASKLVDYVVNKGWDVNYWFIDNEQHLLTDEWEPELYAHYINEYAAKIKETQPAAKFVANWGDSVAGWERILRATNLGNVHMMDIHVYWNKHGWGTLKWSDYVSINEMIWQGKSIRKFVDDFKIKATDLHHSNMEVGFLEWGIGPSPNADMAPSRYQTGIMTADLFMEMIDSDLDTACYWPFRVKNSKSAAYHRALVDDNNQPTFIQNVLSLFQTIKGYTLVHSKNGMYTKSIAALSPDESSMVVYILRKAEGEARFKIYDVVDGGFTPTDASALSYFIPENLGGAKNTAGIDSVPLTEKNVWFDKYGRAAVNLPGWSLTRVILTK